jgi:hypothetical protein
VPIDNSIANIQKRGTKAHLMNFLSKGKLNVNMGRNYGNPSMKKLWIHDLFDELTT